MAEPDPLDWDSIREAEGFTVGDQVRARGGEVGIIRHIFWAKGKHRAYVYRPTIPFECEGVILSPGSVQFFELAKLSKVLEQPIAHHAAPPCRL